MAGAGLLLALLLVVAPIAVVRAATLAPVLKIREINITGDEFVVLQNAGITPVSLAEYWLGYNSDDTASFVMPTKQLPMTTLAAGQSILLNNGSTTTCDASIVDELGISSLNNTKGTLVLRHLQNDGDNSTFTTVDAVSWGKLVTDSINIADETQLPADATKVWYKDSGETTTGWRVGNLANCSLTLLPLTTDDAGQPPKVITWQTNASSPPSIYVGTASVAPANTPHIPATDKGLKAPQLSEILPNPAAPQTDDEDEFIELYNPNATTFDLSGFILQTASTSSSTAHSYHLPVGTTIAPGSFRAFRSSQTNLSLSNSGGQVWLVDPLGTTLDSSAPYGTAKDDQAWVDASGKWQWTLQATPGSTNKVASPLAGNSSSTTATINGKKVTAVANGNAATSGQALGANTVAGTDQPLSIHPFTLAIIILAALLYGAYEYRYDLALRYRQFRRNRSAGR